MKTSAHYYKQWIDEYPFNPEVKGATLNYIRPKFIIITSNYSLQQCFTDPTTGSIRYEDFDPLDRRLCQIQLTKKELQPKFLFVYYIITVSTAPNTTAMSAITKSATGRLQNIDIFSYLLLTCLNLSLSIALGD